MIRNILTLFAGSTAARVISVAAIPLLTRLYLPEDFGLYALFVSVVAIFAPILTLRYESAIPLPKTRSAASALVLTSLLVTSLNVLVLGALLGLVWWQQDLLPMKAQPGLFYGLLLLAAGLNAFFEVGQYWAVRNKSMRVIAKAQILQTSFANISKIALGFFSTGGFGLIAGQLVHQLSGVVAVWSQLHEAFRIQGKRFRLKRAQAMARKYMEFPTIRLPAHLLQALSSKLPLFMSAALFDINATGQLSLAFSAIAIPVSLISQSIGTAYYAEIAAIGSKNAIKIIELTKKVITHLAAIAIVPTIVLAFFGKDIFSLAFGAEWTVAGGIAQILAIAMFFQIIAAPIIHVLSVFGHHSEFFSINFVRVVLIGGAFLVAKLFSFDLTATVGIYCTALTLHYILVSARIFKLLKSNIHTE